MDEQKGLAAGHVLKAATRDLEVILANLKAQRSEAYAKSRMSKNTNEKEVFLQFVERTDSSIQLLESRLKSLHQHLMNLEFELGRWIE